MKKPASVSRCSSWLLAGAATPMLIAMHPETKEIALMVPTKTPGEMGICPIPDEVPDINEEAEMGTINQGRQVCFKWHDWALVPQTSVSAKLYQFLDVQTIEATSFTELEKTFLISDEGIITKSGANQLLFKGISIDDFLKKSKYW